MKIHQNQAATLDRSRHDCGDVPVTVEMARFRGSSGVEEIHLMARPKEYGEFTAQREWLRCATEAVLTSAGLGLRGAVLRRFFCSDLVNQSGLLESQPFSAAGEPDQPCAVSWAGQPPAPPAKVALWAYHINDPQAGISKRQADHTLILTRGQLRHLWTPGIVRPARDSTFGQTEDVFAAYEELLREQDLCLAEHVIRTWLFVRDIDSEYRQLANARREFFARRGLTPDTHYIASSGIQGVCAAPRAKVALDAYAIAGVRPEQIEFIEAPDHLSRTDTYGVTFERATAVSYRDRRHVLISGTASIDSRGGLLHPGDVARQLGRTLENIEALLREAGAAWGDVTGLVAYVRDASDAELVREGIRQRCGEVPLTVVAAPVCRPAWLVEVEGWAIVPASNPDLPPF